MIPLSFLYALLPRPHHDLFLDCTNNQYIPHIHDSLGFLSSFI